MKPGQTRPCHIQIVCIAGYPEYETQGLSLMLDGSADECLRKAVKAKPIVRFVGMHCVECYTAQTEQED